MNFLKIAKFIRMSMVCIAIFIGWRTCKAETTDVILFGDSNTWLGGDACDKRAGWSYHFSMLDPDIRCRSYARSGATWSATKASREDIREYSEVITDNNIIYNQLRRFISDYVGETGFEPDLFIILAGTNDAWFQNRRPEIFEDSPRSLASQVRLVTDLIRLEYPQAKILLLTPPQTTATTIENIRKVGDVIQTTANQLGIDCLRLDSLSPIKADKERMKHYYTTDGIHTSEAGAAAIANIIYRHIRP